jgi:hypothetical protein
MLMLFHPNPRSVERNPFRLQPEPLFQAVFTRERDLSARPNYAMPGQRAGPSQRPNYLSGASRKAGRARHLAVGRYFAFRDFSDRVADDFKHDTRLMSGAGLLRVNIADCGPDRGERG